MKKNRVPSWPSSDQPRLRISGPPEIIDAVPYLLGFAPTESLVVLALSGPRHRVRLTCRVDLPPVGSGPEAELAIVEQVSSAVLRAEPEQVVLVCFSARSSPSSPSSSSSLPAPVESGQPGSAPRPQLAHRAMVQAFTDVFETAGVGVMDALLVSEDRWWSYRCANPRCCPPEGTPRRQGVSRVQAEATMAGLVVHGDRETVRAEIAPVTSVAAAGMRSSLEQAEQRAQARLSRALAEGATPARALGEQRAETVRLAREMLGRWRASREQPTFERAAQLLVGLTDRGTRDEVLNDVRTAQVGAARELWAWLTRHAQPPYDPAPATVFALLAWEMGEGAVATMALQRALGTDPDYRLATYALTAITAGIGPKVARQLRQAGGRGASGEPERATA